MHKKRDKIVNCIIIARIVETLVICNKTAKKSFGCFTGCQKDSAIPWFFYALSIQNGVIELMIKVKDQKLGQNTRKSFSNSRFDYPLPNLVEIQTKSYDWFKKEGLMEVLRDASPITDTYGNLVIEFISYTLDEAHPK